MTPTARIFAINDDPTQLHILRVILEGDGYHVRAFESGMEALEALHAGAEVDLFLVDLHMPGIDGWKFCRLVRSPEYASHNATPILLVSATFTGADVEAITAETGADAFLSVPHTREELLGFVADLLVGTRPRQRMRALVVEDDRAVAESVARAFEQNGYEVSIAATLQDALRAAAERHQDILLLDYHLPDGNAEELLASLRSPADRTAILVMTGDDDPALPARLLAMGADAYARKPFESAFLVELAGKAHRERSLLRVEAVLEKRTQQLRASERRYRSLFDAIPDLVLVLDASGSIVQVNPEVERLLGMEASSLEGRPILELADAEAREELRYHLARVGDTGSAHFETALRRADGTSMEIEVTAVRTDHEGTDAVLVAGRDLTVRRELEAERKRLEERVEHSQRLESLGVLAGGIAHDFNNLLVGILGNASMALMDLPEAGPVRDSLRQIEVAARRAAELTQQILTFAGKGSVVPRRVDLSGLVREMGQLLEPAVSKKARVRYHLQERLPGVSADAGQLRQIAMNLMMNASDALQGRPGTIAVSTGTAHLDRRQLRTCYLGNEASPGTFVYLEVEDDGVGMDAATRKRMFEPFYTTKFTGRGLGLAATLGIVGAHGGAIEVESEPGQGTRFRVYLPVKDDHRDQGPDDDGGDEERLPRSLDGDAGGRILVVDDEPAVRGLARSILHRKGFRTLEAPHGRAALELLHRSPDVDLVLLDLTMPELDGIEVLNRLRREGWGGAVLLSSGYGADNLPPGTLEKGRTAFIRKPYSPMQLETSVRRLLGESRLARRAVRL